jgi:hypothetical protein
MAEWEQRQLCPNGGCIGVIGTDGTCKVCGRAAPNWGDERNRGLNDAADDKEDEEDEQDGADDAAHDRDGVDADDPDGPDDDDDDGDDDDGDGDDGDDDDDDDDEAGIQRVEAPVPAKDWQRRRLCPDGGCIGVIGTDGTCPVCGKVA